MIMDEQTNSFPLINEETTQTINKMKFVVVSQYKEKGPTVNEKIKRLLEREARERNGVHTGDTPSQTGYNE